MRSDHYWLRKKYKIPAAILATKGQKVALVEASEKMYGGTCINVGCITSKCLADNAEDVNGHMIFEKKGEKYRRIVTDKKALAAVLQKRMDWPMWTLSTEQNPLLTIRPLKFKGKKKCGFPERKSSSIPVHFPSSLTSRELRPIPMYISSESLMEEELFSQKLTIIGESFWAIFHIKKSKYFSFRGCGYQFDFGLKTSWRQHYFKHRHKRFKSKSRA